MVPLTKCFFINGAIRLLKKWLQLVIMCISDTNGNTGSRPSPDMPQCTKEVTTMTKDNRDTPSMELLRERKRLQALLENLKATTTSIDMGFKHLVAHLLDAYEGEIEAVVATDMEMGRYASFFISVETLHEHIRGFVGNNQVIIHLLDNPELLDWALEAFRHALDEQFSIQLEYTQYHEYALISGRQACLDGLEEESGKEVFVGSVKCPNACEPPQDQLPDIFSHFTVDDSPHTHHGCKCKVCDYVFAIEINRDLSGRPPSERVWQYAKLPQQS